MMVAEAIQAEELLSRFKDELHVLEAQHLEGRRVLPVYHGVRPAYVGGRPTVRVKRDPERTYTAYYSIRLFELWDDLLEELVDHVEPDAKRPRGAKGRFEWYISKGILDQADDCWRHRRNRWVHEGERPGAEVFAELLTRVRRFLADAQARTRE